MCRAFEETRKEGERNRAISIAKRMLDKGMASYEEIAELTDLSVKEIKELDVMQTA